MQMGMFGRAAEPERAPEEIAKAALRRLGRILAREGPLAVSEAMECVADFMDCWGKWSGVEPGPGITLYPWAASAFSELLQRQGELSFQNVRLVGMAYHRSAANKTGQTQLKKDYHWGQYREWKVRDA